MTTEKLYYENCRLAVFTARVLDCREREGGFAVLLDRTAFYPGGGGQACDTGTLGDVKVTGMEEENGEMRLVDYLDCYPVSFSFQFGSGLYDSDDALAGMKVYFEPVSYTHLRAHET